MATFVLVHPAWLGGWCWRKLVPLLRAHGHEVHTPTLTGLGERAHLAHPGIDLQVHIEDVVNMLSCEDLHGVVLLGNSSGGMVITGVAEQAPARIGQLVYLDAFVPEDGQCLLDLVPPDRRAAMEAQVETEGGGWLLPRFAAAPWDQFVAHAWQVTDRADLAWMLARLRPTPFGQFTAAVRGGNPAAARLPRTYIRTGWPHPGFDRYAQAAGQTTGWRLRRLDGSHLPYITSPGELATVLLELVADPPPASPWNHAGERQRERGSA
jgi:pimeloyl-ACP methyl ester carboxylesterase